MRRLERVYPPFNKKYSTGYLFKKDGRNYVSLYGKKTQERLTMTLARYKMSCKLGRMLRDDEHVDHKDGDKTNDKLRNLQILSQAENNKKKAEEYGGRDYCLVKCPACKKEWEIAKNKITYRKSTACSVSCGRKVRPMKKEHKFIVLKEYTLTQTERKKRKLKY